MFGVLFCNTVLITVLSCSAIIMLRMREEVALSAVTSHGFLGACSVSFPRHRLVCDCGISSSWLNIFYFFNSN